MMHLKTREFKTRPPRESDIKARILIKMEWVW